MVTWWFHICSKGWAGSSDRYHLCLASPLAATSSGNGVGTSPTLSDVYPPHQNTGTNGPCGLACAPQSRQGTRKAPPLHPHLLMWVADMSIPLGFAARVAFASPCKLLARRYRHTTYPSGQNDGAAMHFTLKKERGGPLTTAAGEGRGRKDGARMADRRHACPAAHAASTAVNDISHTASSHVAHV